MIYLFDFMVNRLYDMSTSCFSLFISSSDCTSENWDRSLLVVLYLDVSTSPCLYRLFFSIRINVSSFLFLVYCYFVFIG